MTRSATLSPGKQPSTRHSVKIDIETTGTLVTGKLGTAGVGCSFVLAFFILLVHSEFIADKTEWKQTSLLGLLGSESTDEGKAGPGARLCKELNDFLPRSRGVPRNITRKPKTIEHELFSIPTVPGWTLLVKGRNKVNRD